MLVDNFETSVPAEEESITIAFADDHVAVRKGIISYLKDMGGIDVLIEADNGKELLEELEKSERIPDVCVLDLKMPVMTGFDVVPILKKKWKHMKILVLSTFVEELYVVKMIKAGVNGYLSKSCDPEEIKSALIAIKNDGRYNSAFFIEGIANAMDADALPRLTEKEKIFLNYCCSELNYAEIAKIMKCTLKSVEGYRDNLFRKIKVNNRIGLVLHGLRSGMIQLDHTPF